MTIAATLTSTLAILAALVAFTLSVYRNHRPQPQLALPPGHDTPPPPQTIWEATIAALGHHPAEIDLNPPPCPPWPTWRTIPDSHYQTAIAALTNEH